MKVYVITKGEYSDYGICAVATDRETAEKLQIKYSDNYECAEIEEYDTDHDISGEFNKLFWHVYIDSNGNNTYAFINGGVPYIDFDIDNRDGEIRCHACVIAKTKDQALKIVYDQRAEYIDFQEQLKQEEDDNVKKD